MVHYLGGCLMVVLRPVPHHRLAPATRPLESSSSDDASVAKLCNAGGGVTEDTGNALHLAYILFSGSIISSKNSGMQADCETYTQEMVSKGCDIQQHNLSMQLVKHRQELAKGVEEASKATK